MKLSFRSTLLPVIACLALTLSHAVVAEDAKPAAAAEESAKPKVYGFHGTVASVDNSAKTVSLKKKEGERVLNIDSNSKYVVEGKPATLADIKAGLYAHGIVRKEGKEEIIVNAKFDKEAPAPKDKASEKKPEAVTAAPAGAPAAPEPAAPDAPKKKKKKKNSDSSTNAAPTGN
jgi:hypothetical protein